MTENENKSRAANALDSNNSNEAEQQEFHGASASSSGTQEDTNQLEDAVQESLTQGYVDKMLSHNKPSLNYITINRLYPKSVKLMREIAFKQLVENSSDSGLKEDELVDVINGVLLTSPRAFIIEFFDSVGVFTSVVRESDDWRYEVICGEIKEFGYHYQTRTQAECKAYGIAFALLEEKLK